MGENLILEDDIDFVGNIIVVREDIKLLNVLCIANDNLLKKLKIKSNEDIKVEIYFNFFYEDKIGEFEILTYKKQDEKFILLNDTFKNLTNEELIVIIAKLDNYLKLNKNTNINKFLHINLKMED